MCGISGFFTSGEAISASRLERMTDSVRHRGPDAQGYMGVDTQGVLQYWEDNGQYQGGLQLGFGHRRLNILDLSDRANQPMNSADGRYWISYNGEIYNYLELREELPGFNFKTQSDTEVLLELWAHYGPECLEKLNGIFSFTIYDKLEKRIYLVRDPMGVKPLYFSRNRRGVFWGSEIRVLLASGFVRAQIKSELLERYLLAHWIPDPETLFDGVYKVEPGHYISLSESGEFSHHQYWNFKPTPYEGKSIKQWEIELESYLEEAISRQLRSDVPVAHFLSGGLDSSLIVAKSSELLPNPPTTYTIGFQWSDSKEDSLDLDSARVMRDQYNLDFREIILSPSIVNVLPQIIDTLEEPIADPAAICSYLICEKASPEFKVLLSGQGSDEIFGGYSYYQNGQIAQGANYLPKSVLNGVDKLSHLVPYSMGNVRFQKVHRMRKLFDCLKAPWPEPYFYLRSGMQKQDSQDLLTSDARSIQSAPFERHLEHFSHVEKEDLTTQLMYLDTKTYLPALNLTYTDKTSMAHSTEVRVPYLDLELVKFMSQVPARYKSHLGASKILLKLLARNTLPREIIYRKKTGFGLPIRDWFLNDLQPMAQDLFSQSRLQKQNLFEPKTLARWLKEHNERSADHSFKLYSAMNLQLWLERFSVHA